MKRKVPIVAVLAAGCFSAQAATTSIDFNTDPTGTGLYEEPGGALAAEWRPSGGASGGASDGYLSITDARDSQRAVLVFKDLEDGLVVKSFTFECDLRMGGGNSEPADGFSLNYAAVDDPVITGGAFAGDDGEGNLPEEGTQTGLAIGFDTWQSGRIGPVQDVVGISIRVGGQLVAQLPVPISGTNIYTADEPLPGSQTAAQYVYDRGPYANLATNDVNYRYSMQTGARWNNTTDDLNFDGVVDENDQPGTDAGGQPLWGDPNWDKWVQHLTWEKFKAEVDDQGRVKIWWKGHEVTPPGGLDTDFAPQAGRLIFGARTGGNNQVHHVDNIVLTTQPYTSVVPGTVRANAGGFHFYVADAGNATVAANGVTLNVNGQSVTPTVVKSGSNTVISYKPETLWPVGTEVVLTGSVRDNLGTETTFERTFTVGNYTTIPADFAVPASSVNTGDSGFIAKLHQIAGSRDPALSDANWTAPAEKQLRNAIIDPATLQPYPNLLPNGPAAGGAYKSTVINWNQEAGLAEIGHFRADNLEAPANVPDEPIPGIIASADQSDPAFEGYNNNIAAEIGGYLDLQPGFYTFGVNSDDGFRLAAVRNPEDVLGVTLGEYSGGRGAGEGTSFDVYVPAAGIYPVRLLWWEGGGGANVEFYSIDPVSQNRILVNDPASPLAVKSYATQTSGQRPYVASVAPDRNAAYVLADTNIVITLNDGAFPINDASIKLTLNGTDTTPSIANNGAVTTVTRAGGVANLLPAGVNNVVLTYSYTENGSVVNVTNSYSFEVWNYTVVPPANKVASINRTTEGFVARVHQIDRTLDANEGNSDRYPGDGNILPRPEAQLADALYDATTGQPWPNLAMPDFDGDFVYEIPGGLNFNGSFGGTSGVFPDDLPMPGLPGSGTSNAGQDHYVAEFISYLDLKAGAYIMAVNSDDGFVVSSAPNPHDTLGTVLGVVNRGRGNSGLRLPNESLFGVVIPEDGVYPFRVLYWQGGGGVNVEFLSYDRVTHQPHLVGDTLDERAIDAFTTYTGPARAWVQFSVSPTPWGNRVQQAGPGKPIFYGRSPASVDAGDQFNDSDAIRAFADTGIGAVFANGAGKTFGLVLNGQAVTPTVTTTGTNTLVVYNPPAILPSGSTNTAGLVYEGTTNYWSWIVGTYTNVPAGLALPVSAADPAARGFRAKVVKARNDAGLAANTERAEQQLAGTLIDPATSQPFANTAVPGPEPDGTYLVQTINWNQNMRGGNNVEFGNFRTDSAPGLIDLPDQPIPGIGLGTTEAADANNSAAAEITAWLELPAGYIKMGVNSDDGFKVSIAEAGDTNGVVLHNENRGKGASDVPFSFVVPQAGLYPVRLVWFEGSGDANVEFYSYGPNNVKIPVNADVPGAIKAYYSVTGGTDPNQPVITVARAADGSLNITWTNGGTLQASPAVAGAGVNWQDVDSDGTYTAAPAASTMFYRVRK